MKQTILTLFALLVFSVSSFSQGINFEHGNWASVKAKAKKENKIIFIDVYTAWCGPCKMMAKNIFPEKEVGDFFNKNFVNYKIDAEKGEGVALKTKYGIKAYPTLIFVDANGKFLHQGVGSRNATELIDLGKTAMNPSKQLGKLLNSNTQKDTPTFLRKLSKERLPYNDKYEAYIKSLSKKKLFSKATYDLMVELGGREAKGFTFDLISKNRTAFAKVVGEREIENYFYNKYLAKAYTAKLKKEPLQPIYDAIKSKGFNFAPKIEATLKLTAHNYVGEYDAFLKEAPVYVEKYCKNDIYSKFRAVFMEAIKFANHKPELLQYAIKVGNELIAIDYKVADVNAYLGQKYADAGKLKTALKYYQKASAYNQKKGVEDNAKQSVDFLKERIAVLEKGDYTYHISGLDKYNGLVFKLSYNSPIKIGEYEETKGVLIKDGKCTVKGNVKAPIPAVWAVYDGDYLKIKGKVILEPGAYKATVDGHNLEVKNGWYNYYMYQGLRENPQNKVAKKTYEEFRKKKGDMKDPAVRKEFFKHNEALNKARENYYKGLYLYNANTEVKILAFYLGDLWHDDNAEAELKKLKATLGDHYLLKTIAHHRANNKRNREMRASVSVGKQIKPFTAKDINGKAFELEKVLKNNQYVLLEFWASWCGPCRGAIPHLKELYKKYHQQGFEIVSFSLDHKKNMWTKASQKEDIPWINTSDLLARKSPIVKMYGVTGVPYSLLVDKNGKIIFKQMGMSKNLDKKLKEVFK